MVPPYEILGGKQECNSDWYILFSTEIQGSCNKDFANVGMPLRFKKWRWSATRCSVRICIKLQT